MSKQRPEKNRLPTEILRGMRRDAPVYRLNMIARRNNATVPQADKNSLNNWIKANVDLGGGDWLEITLSATGNNPYTHAGCSAMVTERDFRRITRRLLNLSNITPPDDYDTYSRREKRTWLISQAAAIKAATGVVLTVAVANDSGDPGFNALLAQEGLQRT